MYLKTPLEQFEHFPILRVKEYKYPVTHFFWSIFEYIDAHFWHKSLTAAIYKLYDSITPLVMTPDCEIIWKNWWTPQIKFIVVDGVLQKSYHFFDFCAYPFLFLCHYSFTLLHTNYEARKAHYANFPEEVILPLVMNSSFIIIAFFFLLIVFVSTLLLANKLLFNSYQIAYTQYFTTIEQIIRDLITNKTGKQYYYSFLIFLFIFINLCNLHSLIPYSYAITSNFAVTFTLSFIFFFMLNLTGILYHGIYLLNLFFPSGTPFIILPLLIIIEIISYFARMFSLAIRLFANITAGHILLKILSWFTYLLKNVFFIAIIMSLVISSLWVLEFFISILQAYVFLILLCIYVNEVLQLH